MSWNWEGNVLGAICVGVILLIVAVIAMALAPPTITEGEVYKKEFRTEITSVSFMPMTTTVGKTTITTLIPYSYRYPNRWVIFIRAWSEDEQTYLTEDFFVDENHYNQINIGDWITFADGEGSNNEPYTRTQMREQ